MIKIKKNRETYDVIGDITYCFFKNTPSFFERKGKIGDIYYNKQNKEYMFHSGGVDFDNETISAVHKKLEEMNRK